MKMLKKFLLLASLTLPSLCSAVMTPQELESEAKYMHSLSQESTLAALLGLYPSLNFKDLVFITKFPTDQYLDKFEYLLNLFVYTIKNVQFFPENLFFDPQTITPQDQILHTTSIACFCYLVLMLAVLNNFEFFGSEKIRKNNLVTRLNQLVKREMNFPRFLNLFYSALQNYSLLSKNPNLFQGCKDTIDLIVPHLIGKAILMIFNETSPYSKSFTTIRIKMKEKWPMNIKTGTLQETARGIFIFSCREILSTNRSYFSDIPQPKLCDQSNLEPTAIAETSDLCSETVSSKTSSRSFSIRSTELVTDKFFENGEALGLINDPFKNRRRARSLPCLHKVTEFDPYQYGEAEEI